MKKVISIFIFSMVIVSSYSFSVYLAPVRIVPAEDAEIDEYDAAITDALFKTIKQVDSEAVLTVNLLSSKKGLDDIEIMSRLDASATCELYNVDYLVYGYIEKNNTYYTAELRLFENSTKQDKKLFFAKTEVYNRDEMVDELSKKFVSYMHKMLGAGEYIKERKRGFGGIAVTNGLGYWVPITSWNNMILGLFNFETGVNVVPTTPLVKTRSMYFYLRYGFYVTYNFGKNKTGLATFYIHSFLFKIPLEICFEVLFRNVFFLGVGPQLQFDVAYRKPLYDDPVTETALGFSLGAYIGYEYWFGANKRTAIGIRNLFTVTFIDPLYVDYKINIYSAVKIPVKNVKAKEK